VLIVGLSVEGFAPKRELGIGKAVDRRIEAVGD
jgi:hypothetical protein